MTKSRDIYYAIYYAGERNKELGGKGVRKTKENYIKTGKRALKMYLLGSPRPLQTYSSGEKINTNLFSTLIFIWNF